MPAMRTLYHQPLSPQCRKIRILLKEKAQEFDLVVERDWERRAEFLAMNPGGSLPVLVEPDGTVFAEHCAVTEYLDEAYPDRPMIGFSVRDRAEARRLAAWFDSHFDGEVSRYLLGEKVVKRQARRGQTDAAAIRAGAHNIHYHLDYIGYLCERRRWLAGDDFSIADISAAAHLSAIDYLGDVPWDDHAEAREWYARVKSRPSMRPLLADRIAEVKPPAWYDDLDF
jgi:glutathione S-transferase